MSDDCRELVAFGVAETPAGAPQEARYTPASRKRIYRLGHVAQKVEVGLATGVGVDDGGKIAREVVGVAAGEKGEREPECNLAFTDQLTGSAY
jgi:hypothetical protein